MKIDLQFSKLKNSLFSMAIFLIAFDSFPFFIGGSVYRPISIFPLLIYFCLYVYERLLKSTIRKIDFYFISFFFILLFISYAKTYSYQSYDGTIDFFTTGIIGVASFISINDYVVSLKTHYNNSEVFEITGQKYIKAMYLPCLLGCIQALETILHIKLPFTKTVYNLLTYRFVYGRVFLVCGEPAWASIYLIILIFFLFYCNDVKYKKLKIFVSCGLILLTLSMLGYLSIILVIVIYLFFVCIKRPKFIVTMINFIVIFIVIVICFDKLVMSVNNSNYAINRYLQLKELFIYVLTPEQMLRYIQTLDGSIFVRFINPIIAIMIGIAHPFFGTGAGFYYIYYPKYILKYFPLSVGFFEVYEAVYGTYQITPRNLFCKFIAEYGLLFGLIIFLKCFSYILKINKYDNKMLWLFALLFMSVFNFDSLCYIVFIFLLVLLINLTKEEKKCS